MNRARLDAMAEGLGDDVVAAVRDASTLKTAQRKAALASAFADAEVARVEAAAIKADVLDRLPQLLDQLDTSCAANGIFVHHCPDAAAAREAIIAIVRNCAPPGAIVAKAKSMATEEIGLNQALEGAGYQPIETDLGEFVVQIDGDQPSHIVTPIIHKTRREVGRSFARIGLGPYTEDPETLTHRARAHLRRAFREAAVGVSGVNFVVAESGRLVLVENEGNNRLSTTAPRVHIAVMGIEKIIPREADLPLFLRLLAGSATGQRLTVYTHLISGPRQPDESDGPEAVHLILLDNGRTRVLDGPLKDILRCIRCGACLNTCPVYRRASGHSYGHVYSGPLGAVLAPALEGLEKHMELANASTLCGACEEVCPVKIPIPELLLRLRAERGPDRAMGALAMAGSSTLRWSAGLRLLPMAAKLPVGPLAAWKVERTAPQRRGRDFRTWWRTRSGPEPRHEFPVEKASAVPDPTARDQPVDLWALFTERLLELGGRMATINDIAAVKGNLWIDDDALAHLQTRLPSLTRGSSPWRAHVGITMADLAIADVGGLALSAGPGRRRLASLAPPIHVALVRRANIVATLEEAPVQWSKRTGVLVVGPSRTADIEGVLVRGVHGPGQLWVVVID